MVSRYTVIIVPRAIRTSSRSMRSVTTLAALMTALHVGQQVDALVFFFILGSTFRKHLGGRCHNINACDFLLNNGDGFHEGRHRGTVYSCDNDSDDFLCAFAHNAASACAVRIKLSHFEKSIRFAARL